MNTKLVPALVMLLAGAVCCIVTFVNGYSLREMLITLTIVLLIFLVLGFVFRILLEIFKVNEVKAQNEEVEEGETSDEGEVVDKTSEGESIEGVLPEEGIEE